MIEREYDTGWREGYEAASGQAHAELDRLRESTSAAAYDAVNQNRAYWIRQAAELEIELERLRPSHAELVMQNHRLKARVERLQELLDEVMSCGHWSDCPAGINSKYRCRCAYGILASALPDER